MNLIFKNLRTPYGKKVLICKNENFSPNNKAMLRKALIRRLTELGQKKCLLFFKNAEKVSDCFPENHSKYELRHIYQITRTDLKDTTTKPPSGIKSFKFKNKEFYFKSLKNKLLFYYKLWSKFLNKKEYLDLSIHRQSTKKYLCLKKNRTTAALVDLWEYKNYIYCPMDWIGYIWINPELNPEERAGIHKFIKFWLYKNMSHSVLRASVASYNLRSQKFFTKMGFKTAWISFSVKK